jgi:hypothetical protein
LNLPPSNNQYLQRVLLSKSKIANSRNENEYGTKVAMFSFDRLPGSDVLLGVTMKSTGEIATFSTFPHIGLLKSLRAAKRYFSPPPGVSFKSLKGHEKDMTAAAPAPAPRGECIVNHQEGGSQVFCIALRGIVRENELGVLPENVTSSSQLDRVVSLFDEMIEIGYVLAKCHPTTLQRIGVEEEDEQEEEEEEEEEAHITASFTLSSSKQSMYFIKNGKFISGGSSLFLDNQNVVGLIDICSDNSICQDETGYLLRRNALDLNVPVFTDINLVEASVAAWKKVQQNRRISTEHCPISEGQ